MVKTSEGLGRLFFRRLVVTSFTISDYHHPKVEPPIVFDENSWRFHDTTSSILNGIKHEPSSRGRLHPHENQRMDTKNDIVVLNVFAASNMARTCWVSIRQISGGVYKPGKK